MLQAGTTLQQLSSTMDPITVESVALLVVFALLSLGMKKVEQPVFRKYRERPFLFLSRFHLLSK
jgi:hypothetical protein